ncbi:penicillin-binding protein PBP2X [Streptococcus thoraltensis]|uniref:penicillin-binding protein PBP2X n=1 Tax=Streptococcus thoraltensis TaxID=55085 RepID=UPI002A838B93|nr:penicillin-binding protein PBP2X [Streptococcus thoraltensis]MDY4762202.1 penicillin-binding protein PBP2X [Streptococcus thoraltensis]
MSKLRKLFLDYVVKIRKEHPEENRRYAGQNLMILTVFIFFVFVINFAVIVGTDSKFGVDLSEGAKAVYNTRSTLQARRGSIFDRNGNVIAENSTTYSVYAIIDKTYVNADQEKLYVQPSQFDKVAEIFSNQLGMKKKYVISQLKQQKLTQVSFGTKGSNLSYSKMSALKDAIEKEKIKGISFDTSTSRMYPNGVFASQFIGLAQPHVEKDGSTILSGVTGVEASLDDVLSGKDGTVEYEKDRNGNILLGTQHVVKKAADGRDVYTTLSAPLQTYLETQMDAFQAEAKGKFASATIVNSQTGEILATTQRPSFNSDTLDGLDDKNFSWQNMLYQTNYEPGSTMKVMTLASAIDDKKFKANEYFTNSGLDLSGIIVNDWSVNNGTAGIQTMTFAQGFAYSSNVGMILLEQKMGNAKWRDYLTRFKFGEPTYFGMGSESAGVISNNSVNTSTSAFGQGISVTQSQMLRAFSGVSNDGEMLEPQFISQVVNHNDSTSRVAKPEIVGKPVSKKAAEETREHMVAVGTTPYYGTLYANWLGEPIIQVGNESIAVKSGIAEIAKEDGSGYLTGEHDYIYSVVAMVPAEKPIFTMYVTVQQPGSWKGFEWRTIFNPVLQEAMTMQDQLLTSVAAKEKRSETTYEIPDFVGKSTSQAVDTLRKNLVHPIIVGDGAKVTKMSVTKGTKLKANQQILVQAGKVEEMPDMYGWSKRNVQAFAKWNDLSITIKGSGKVVKQNTDVGTPFGKKKNIKITLGE